MEEMSKIQNLKKLGLSLEDIKAVVEEKMTAMREDLRRLSKRLQAWEGLYEHAENIKNSMSKIVIKSLQGGVVASFRRHIKSYDALGTLCVSVIGPEMQRLGCRCPEGPAYCFTVDYNRTARRKISIWNITRWWRNDVKTRNLSNLKSCHWWRRSSTLNIVAPTNVVATR